MAGLQSLANDGERLSWAFTGVLALAILKILADGHLVWAGFLGLTLVVLLLPAALFRDASAMLPPEVTAMAAFPGVARALGPAWLTEYATYVGVAAVALAVVVELALFTDAEMSPRFADAMVVLTTMAAIGVWVILRFYSDRFLGTEFLDSKNAVNWEFVRATVAGVVGAAVFEFHFDYDHPVERDGSDLPEGERG